MPESIHSLLFTLHSSLVCGGRIPYCHALNKVKVPGWSRGGSRISERTSGLVRSCRREVADALKGEACKLALENNFPLQRGIDSHGSGIDSDGLDFVSCACDFDDGRL